MTQELTVHKARIGNVIVKRVGEQWHVYEVGPVAVVDSFDEAVALARRMQPHANDCMCPQCVGECC